MVLNAKKVDMNNRLIPVGFSNYLSTDRIVAIAIPKSAPIKRSVQDAMDKGLIIDLTDGRRKKAVIFTDANYVVLSALAPATISGRLEATCK